ncbi:hypothetical protein KC329_g73 [Hortaea werneckii]|nr:hypothetical protein KC329_g73 [Hortaea werneckii]
MTSSCGVVETSSPLHRASFAVIHLELATRSRSMTRHVLAMMQGCACILKRGSVAIFTSLVPLVNMCISATEARYRTLLSWPPAPLPSPPRPCSLFSIHKAIALKTRQLGTASPSLDRPPGLLCPTHRGRQTWGCFTTHRSSSVVALVVSNMMVLLHPILRRAGRWTCELRMYRLGKEIAPSCSIKASINAVSSVPRTSYPNVSSYYVRFRGEPANAHRNAGECSFKSSKDFKLSGGSSFLQSKYTLSLM